MEECGKGEKSNNKCREWKANVTVTMKDRKVNIDEIVILSQSNKFLLCGGNEEGINGNRYSSTVK